MINIYLASLSPQSKPDYGYLIWILVYIIAIPITFFYKILSRANFHYTLNQSYLMVKSGVLYKKLRNTPYGIIQNIILKQGIIDRLFGLATLKIENAAQAGGLATIAGQNTPDAIISNGNAVMIPGLNFADAQTLKATLQDLMRKNPTIEQGL